MTPNDSDILLYRIAFSLVKGVNVSTGRRLLELIGTPRDFFTMDLRECIRVTGMNATHFNEAYRAELLEKARKEIDFIRQHDIDTLWFADSRYPQRLSECEDAPVLLYAKGQCNLNPRHVIGIVGTRNATHYGANFIGKLVDELSSKISDLLVVSGLALGCDVIAHRRAMAAGVPTAGVVAHGLDTIYPPENRNDAARMASGAGAVITDYTTGTRPYRGNFLARNRIVAGMADCLMVVESAADHGGALHTARLAREYNREVFALPGRATDHYSGGCNRLLRDNIAQLCTCADDIISTMGWETIPSEGVQTQLFRELSPEEKLIVDLLEKLGDMQINELTMKTGMPISRLSACLMTMEMDGLVQSIPGARYRKV